MFRVTKTHFSPSMECTNGKNATLTHFLLGIFNNTKKIYYWRKKRRWKLKWTKDSFPLQLKADVMFLSIWSNSVASSQKWFEITEKTAEKPKSKQRRENSNKKWSKQNQARRKWQVVTGIVFCSSFNAQRMNRIHHSGFFCINFRLVDCNFPIIIRNEHWFDARS